MVPDPPWVRYHIGQLVPANDESSCFRPNGGLVSRRQHIFRQKTKQNTYINIIIIMLKIRFLATPVKLVCPVSPSIAGSLSLVLLMSMSSSKAEEGGREGAGEGERGEEEVVEGWWEGPVVEVAMENVLLGLEGGWGGRGDCGRERGEGRQRKSFTSDKRLYSHP